MPGKQKYSDAQFLEAVKNTTQQRGQLQTIANYVGCSKQLAAKRLRTLKSAGKIKIHYERDRETLARSDPWGSKKKTFDFNTYEVLT